MDRLAACRFLFAFHLPGIRIRVMPLLLDHFLKAFIPLFVAIDPIGLAALFLGLSAGVPAETRRKISRQAAVTAGAVTLLFLFLGEGMFRALGITTSDFQVAGGLILFLLAARELMLSAAVEPARLADDFGVVPLGMPLIAGPATITTVLLTAKTIGLWTTLVALAINLVLVVMAFAYSGRLGQLIGITGMRAISKIIALLLAAIAVAMIRRGLAG